MDIVYILNLRFKKNVSFCASYCLYIVYLTKMFGIDFEPAVLNLYYQKIL